ncbi:MAG: hypothetical protein V1811_01110 [Candidatus Micrarchaeota archaeon]
MKAFATAVFALLATLLLAYVGMNVMLYSNSGVQANQALEAQLVQDRWYDFKNIWKRTLDDVSADTAYSYFSCSSSFVAYDPTPGSPYQQRLDNLCTDLNGGVKILQYETAAFTALHDAGDAVSFEPPTSISIQCKKLTSGETPSNLYPLPSSEVLEITQTLDFKISVGSAVIHRQETVQELLTVTHVPGLLGSVKTVKINLHNLANLAYSVSPPTAFEITC